MPFPKVPTPSVKGIPRERGFYFSLKEKLNKSLCKTLRSSGCEFPNAVARQLAFLWRHVNSIFVASGVCEWSRVHC